MLRERAAASCMSIAEPEADPEPIADADATDANGQSYSNQNDTYGKTWMYIPDGDGVPQVAYLTEEAETSRGRRKNVKDSVRFELYKWVFSTILNL